ncbi:MAG: energy transducer TonB [Candidatus Sulfotelmatobacter sp.]
MLKRQDTNRRPTTRYRRPATLGLLMMTMMLAFLSIVPSLSQTLDQKFKQRKLITRVDPKYPAALKRLFIGGVVRIEVLIAPDGTVQKATLLGGSPYLGQAAMEAIKEWKYAPAVSNETITVKIDFDPHR